MVIPSNVTVATNAFFAGVETRRNAATLRSYKVILEQLAQEVVDKINDLQLNND